MFKRIRVTFLLLAVGVTMAKAHAEPSDSSDGTFVHYESFHSNLVGPLPVDVWLPADYRVSGNGYLVIYMLEGQMVFDKPTTPLTPFILVGDAVEAAHPAEKCDHHGQGQALS